MREPTTTPPKSAAMKKAAPASKPTPRMISEKIMRGRGRPNHTSITPPALRFFQSQYHAIQMQAS